MSVSKIQLVALIIIYLLTMNNLGLGYSLLHFIADISRPTSLSYARPSPKMRKLVWKGRS